MGSMCMKKGLGVEGGGLFVCAPFEHHLGGSTFPKTVALNQVKHETLPRVPGPRSKHSTPCGPCSLKLGLGNCFNSHDIDFTVDSM